MTKFVSFLKDESGAAAAEYALILAIVGSALAAAALGLGNSIAGALNNAGDQIEAVDYSPA
jgi:pilus assembly protein Flp/PilA